MIRKFISLALLLQFVAIPAYAWSGDGGNPTGAAKIFIVGIAVALIIFVLCAIVQDRSSRKRTRILVSSAFIVLNLAHMMLYPFYGRPEFVDGRKMVLYFTVASTVLWFIRVFRPSSKSKSTQEADPGGSA